MRTHPPTRSHTDTTRQRVCTRTCMSKRHLIHVLGRQSLLEAVLCCARAQGSWREKNAGGALGDAVCTSCLCVKRDILCGKRECVLVVFGGVLDVYQVCMRFMHKPHTHLVNINIKGMAARARKLFNLRVRKLFSLTRARCFLLSHAESLSLPLSHFL